MVTYECRQGQHGECKSPHGEGVPEEQGKPVAVCECEGPSHSPQEQAEPEPVGPGMSAPQDTPPWNPPQE